MRRLFKLIRYLKPYLVSLLIVFATMALATVMGLLTPWPTKFLVDNVLGDEPMPGYLQDALDFLPGRDDQKGLLLWVAISGLLIFLFSTLLSAINTLASTRLSQKMTYDLGADLFNHLQKLSLMFHSRRPTGDTIARVTGDPACVQVMVLGALVPLVHSVVTMVAMFAIMYALQPGLTLLALGIVPFLVLTIKVYARPLRQRNRAQRDYEGQVMSLVERTLTAIPVVQAFTREEAEYQRFRRYADDTVDAYQKAQYSNIGFKFCAGLSTAVGTAVILYLGGTYVIEGKMTVGEVLVFLAYLSGLYGPLNAMTYTGSTLQYGAAQADRVMELMEVEPDVQDAPDAIDLRVRGHIRYEDVEFGYEEGRPVLKSVSLEANPGEVVAIVGPTGAGKTTLVNLLVRFYDPWSGRITIDGHDLRKVRIRSLREQISMVLQDPFIFPITVAENIAYGRPDASREEIEAAAVAANADEFIQRLPDGYDAVIGEKGTSLSGGEKQRLSIARAFLKDAPILILDEPTSALDARTEAMLLDALERLMKGRLTFIIAHRLSTIRDADQILAIESGEIVQRGRHEDLLVGGGLYANLYNSQMRIALHEQVAQQEISAMKGIAEAENLNGRRARASEFARDVSRAMRSAREMVSTRDRGNGGADDHPER